MVPYLPLPKLSAIFGLDAAGVVAEVGELVTDVAVGDRVYVNPGAGPGTTVLIDGVSGTLGLGVCLIALGLGVTRILGTGRNAALLTEVQAIAPGRIEVLPIGTRPVADWAFALADVNEALDDLPARHGGFSNYLCVP